MAEITDTNIFPSIKIPRTQRATVMQEAVPQLKSKFAEEWLYLRNIAKPEELDLIENLEAYARLDIKELHAKAGIPLSDEQLPTVFVVPANKWEEVRNHLGSTGTQTQGFVLFEGTTVAVKEDNNILSMAITLHHELMHGIGKVATIVDTDSYRKGQQGYRTAGKVKRGEALEEGTSEYFALEFVKNSIFPALVTARKQAAITLLGEDNPSAELQRKSTEAVLMQEEPHRYRYARNLVATLIRLGDNETQSLLLASRIDAAYIRRLVDNLNMTFNHPEVGRRVFATQFEENSIKKTLLWLNGPKIAKNK